MAITNLIDARTASVRCDVRATFNIERRSAPWPFLLIHMHADPDRCVVDERLPEIELGRRDDQQWVRLVNIEGET